MSSDLSTDKENGDARLTKFDPKKCITVGLECIGTEPFVNYTRMPPSALFIPKVVETAKPHAYERLPPGHARFLRRVPQANENELIFDFISLPISDTECEEKYIAISYCWGALPADQALGLIDGSTIPVTARVVHILQEIIYRARCNVIWIDAICINQQDPIEKSGQISLMTGIYRSAESVEIWLDTGPSSMRVIGETILSRNVSPNAIFRAGILRPRDAYSAFPPYTDSEIIELMWSPWFERAWVIQEYCYSKVPKFHYRGISITILFLKRVFEWGRDLAFTRLEDGDGSRCEVLIPPMIRHYALLRDRRTLTAQSVLRPNPLEDILGEFFHCKATDPHDKVIAFLGMANGKWLDTITIDYERSPAAFYLGMVIAMMRYSTDFALLGFAGITSRRPLFSDEPGVPSWLPDFTSAPHHVAWSWHWERFNASGTHAGGGVQPEFVHPPIEECHVSCNAIMITGGICIDTVVGFLPGDEQRNFAYLPSFLTAALAISDRFSPYPTGESARDVLWKTLIAADPWCLENDETGAGFDQLCEWAKAGNLDLKKIWALKGRYYQTMLVEGGGGTRGLFWTKNGYIGLAANGVEVDDEIWLFLGSRVPFILRGPTIECSREWENQGCYELVAECYLHGAMKGELNANWETKRGFA
ncbi:heterokaryon incompatibility protein-domain-containing protein [Xylaria telfairii]|nr:heterokaryon incompatibility protein-domain-containing protein [Xylaria telfairii]